MSDKTNVSAHWSFWIVSILALLWNLGGTINFLMQSNLEYVAALPETHRAIIEGRPDWASGGFGIGVVAGAIGSVLLLFRKSIALYVFIISLLGVAVTMIHTVKVASTKVDFSSAEIFVMVLLPVIVAAAFIWYAKHARSNGWIS